MNRLKQISMPHKFKVGDAIKWNFAGNNVPGKVIKIHTSDFDFKGATHRAGKEEPLYEVKSDKSGETAVHKEEAITKL